MTRLLSLLGGYLKQPRVIFEVIGGILLGPSALGRNKNYLNKIFPTASLSYLSLVANIGLVLYLFLVGLELDPRSLATHAKVRIMQLIIHFIRTIMVSSMVLRELER